MAKNKIDFVIGSLIRGGAEHVIAILANHFSSLGWDVNVLLLLHGAIDYDIDPRVTVVHMHGAKKSRLLRVPYWLKSLKKHFFARRPNVVVSFVCRINILTLLSLNIKGYRPRIVVSERNDPRFDGRGRIASFLSKRLYPKSDAVIFQSRLVQQMYGLNIQRKSFIVLNPIELNAVWVEPEKRHNVIVSAGRLSSQKNHAALISAFHKIADLDECKDYSLSIHGDGELHESLLRLVDELSLRGRVSVLPNSKTVQQQIAQAKFFVLPSRYEGLSNALMEANALGIPSLTTPTAGSDEIIVAGDNGLISDGFDADSLASSLCKLLSLSAKEYAKMSSSALVHAQRYSTDCIINEYERILTGSGLHAS